MDTHRPKPTTARARANSCATSVGKSGGGEGSLSLKLPAGASGEIVKDAMSPILPISPKLYPRGGAAIKDPKPPQRSTAPPKHETDMAALDLGDAALSEPPKHA